MRWFIKVAANSLLGVLLAASGVIGDGGSAGTTSGNAVLGRFGNKEALKQNLTVPMTNSTTQMQTLDGSKSFSAAMGMPSSKRFLEVMIQPSGTGDLSTVIVAQDLNSDGTFDHTFSLGVPVAGICADGFISCSPGTWNNCQPYKWVSDDAGKLSFAAAGMSMLASCYCINSSCGSSLVWTNTAIVLKDLGGGAVGAIHAKDATKMITDVSTDMTTITYYGQLTKQAGSTAGDVPALGGIPTATQQSYYANWPALESDSAAIPLNHGGNPESMYYQLVNSAASTGGTQVTCTDQRLGAITPTVESTSMTSPGVSYFGTDYNALYTVSKVNDKLYKLYLAGRAWRSGSPGILFPVAVQTLDLPDDANRQTKLTKILFNVQWVACGGGASSYDTQAQGFDNWLFAPGGCAPSPDWGKAAGSGTGGATWSYEFVYQMDTYAEAINEGCAGLAARADCKLRDEAVDGVVTQHNYNKTGLRQLASCSTLTGSVAPMQICRDWWERKRTYVCENDRLFDFSDMKKRFSTVVQSTNDETSKISFTDFRSGGYVAENMNLPGRELYGECEQACRVKRPKRDTQVAVTGLLSSQRISSDSHDVYYLSCTSGNVCPTEAGDIIDEPCGCLNRFGEAATIMQTMRLGGADSICSSGVPQK